MAKIPRHIIDDIMQTARIEEVIGQFVNLKRAGSSLKGLSPFTDEKTPSFVVSPSKQIFKCFSSGKGGNVVTFLMEKEHFSYPEALRWLADKYGIAIPEDEPMTAEELAAISERESLHIVNDFARDHFVQNLHESEEGKAIGLSYFLERGFRPEIIQKFQLGYSINNSDDFTKTALSKGYRKIYLENVGLTKTKEDRSYDFFRGRVMFPIHSVSGRVLGFGGRTLFTEKKIAKYFNSPESTIYNKSEILYGLHFAKGDIIKYDHCFLCEGYTDVISMYQAGVKNVVSSSGTSLTREQIRLIKRYTKNITILYDGDAAGIRASFRGIDLILEEGMNVKVVLFPEGEDPDSYSKSVSSSELQAYISEHQQDFISFKVDLLLDADGNDPIKRAQLIKDISRSVSLIPDQITRSVFVPEVAKRFNLKEEIIWNEVTKDRNEWLQKEQEKIIRKQTETSRLKGLPTNASDQPDNHLSGVNASGIPIQRDSEGSNERLHEATIDHNEYDLIRIMVQYGPMAIAHAQMNEQGELEEIEISIAELVCHELDIDELVFDHPTYATIHRIIADALSKNELLKSSYFKRSENQDIVKFVTDIELNQHEVSHNWIAKYNIYTKTEQDKLKQAVIGSIYGFKVSKVEKRIREIQHELKNQPNLDDDLLMTLLSEQVALENVKKAISEKLGRIVIR